MERTKLLLMMGLAFAMLGLGHPMLAQCPSNTTFYPAPFPDSYPCMQSLYASNPECCLEFTPACAELLRSSCDDGGGFIGNCTVDRCGSSGCSHLLLAPCLSGGCMAYANPRLNDGGGGQCTQSTQLTFEIVPPGPNPPTELDGCLVEVFNFDGFCCNCEWDPLCQEMLDLIGDSGQICDDGDPNTIDGCSPMFGCIHVPKPPAGSPIQTIARLKVFLEGPYDPATNEMSNGLLNNNVLPITQPFNQPPWNYAGTESVGSTPKGIEWLLIELRNASDLSFAGRSAAILQDDGSVEDVSGEDGAIFSGVSAGTYYIIVRSRNHLDVMSASPVFLPNNEVYDFTIEGGQAFRELVGPPSGPFTQGDIQMKLVKDETVFPGDETFALYAGDFDGDGDIDAADKHAYHLEMSFMNQYTKSDLDFNTAATVHDYDLYLLNLPLGLVAPDPVKF